MLSKMFYCAITANVMPICGLLNDSNNFCSVIYYIKPIEILHLRVHLSGSDSAISDPDVASSSIECEWHHAGCDCDSIFTLGITSHSIRDGSYSLLNDQPGNAIR